MIATYTEWYSTYAEMSRVIALDIQKKEIDCQLKKLGNGQVNKSLVLI